ncbi:MAG: flagellar hook protein FlgE [Ignavibacteriaceae bacterium]|jgi:flagellar hook protein FlgE|nr:flagellar hook protein FlgE [Ignavibacteriaceae bacterium]
MALLNSLFAGVSGLRNHQTMMDVIGNNIANVNTIGYKGSRVTFSDTFNQFIKAGTNPTDTSGGTNTYQVGLGMKVNSIDRNWSQGTFERTGITTDLALQGNGLFVLKSNGENFYSRAGGFVFDADGKLVSPQNGAIVQGKVASADGVIPPGNNLQDIMIDANLKLPAVSTNLIKWGGNLKSSSALTRSESVVTRGNIDSSAIAIFPAVPPAVDSVTKSATIFNEAGAEFTFKQTFTKTAADTYDVTWKVYDPSSATPDVAIQSSAAPISVVFADDGNGNFVMNAASKAKFDGVTLPIDNLVNIPSSGIKFTFDPSAISQNSATSTLSASADGNRDANIVSGAVSIFDSLGNSHQVTLTFTKIDTNTWAWNAGVPSSSTDDGKAASANGTLTFNADGTLDPTGINPSSPQLAFNPIGGANPVVLDLDFGQAFGGVTQTSASSVVSALSQNGSASASLSNMNIDQYGNVVGIFTNGNSKTLAQIMVATFTNLNGLISKGDNLFIAYANSGTPRIGSLGEETGTTVQSGALEQSNVDLSEEFTKMIVSQRGFQANARVITTADSLLQEITNLIR